MLTHGGMVPRFHALALEICDSDGTAVTVLSYGLDDCRWGDYPGGRELREPLKAERFLRLLAGKEGGRNSQKTPTHEKESTRHCGFEGCVRRDAGGLGAESQQGSGDLAATTARI